MNKTILNKVLILSEVAEMIGTSEQNLTDMIKNGRVLGCHYRLRKAKNKSRGTYIFHEDFLEYYNNHIRKFR